MPANRHPKTERVIQLARTHVPPWAIAEVLGLEDKTVHHILKYARRRGEAVPRFGSGVPRRNVAMRVKLPVPEQMILNAAATARGTSPDALVSDLIRRIARQGRLPELLKEKEPE